MTREAGLPIGLVALDLDGTTVDEDLVVGERTKQAIARAVGAGVSVSIVTGRMPTSAMAFARELGLTAPIVGYQGAIIREIPTPDSGRLGRILLHKPLAPAAARDAVTWSRRIGLDPHVNHLERFIIRADDPRAEDYSSFLGGRLTVTDDLLAWIRHPVSKVIAVSEGPIDESVLDEARAHFSGRANVTISHPRFLEFLRPGVTKGTAVEWLARRAGVAMENVLAVGDQFNDLEMIAAAGHGAAMPHAPAPVRAAARYIAPPVGQEGVAQLIEALVLADPEDAGKASRRLEAAAAADRRKRGELPPLPATA